MNRTITEGYNSYQLKLSASMGMLVSVYVDPDYPDDFIPGFVCAINHRQALFNTVSPYGRYDGRLSIRLSRIVSVLNEDDVAARLKLLLSIYQEVPPAKLAIRPDEDLAQALCREARRQSAVVSLFTASGDYTGFVDAMDDMRVSILTLDYFGRPAERVTLKWRDIDMASLDSDEERILGALHAHFTGAQKP